MQYQEGGEQRPDVQEQLTLENKDLGHQLATNEGREKVCEENAGIREDDALADVVSLTVRDFTRLVQMVEDLTLRTRLALRTHLHFFLLFFQESLQVTGFRVAKVQHQNQLVFRI